jgi:hypothetical protein
MLFYRRNTGRSADSDSRAQWIQETAPESRLPAETASQMMKTDGPEVVKLLLTGEDSCVNMKHQGFNQEILAALAFTLSPPIVLRRYKNLD